MFYISKRTTTKYKIFNGFARRLRLAAAVIALPCIANANFFVLDNQGDPKFNQLLGINNSRVIVGYFGGNLAPDLTPSNGYVLIPENHYSAEDFLISGSPAAQTQANGVNNLEIPEIVGFYTDGATGFTHGFLDVEGGSVNRRRPGRSSAECHHASAKSAGDQ